MSGIVATIVVCVIVSVLVILDVRKIWKDNRRGKTCCGGKCSACEECGKRKQDVGR